VAHEDQVQARAALLPGAAFNNQANRHAKQLLRRLPHLSPANGSVSM